jgi:hypothetical protein
MTKLCLVLLYLESLPRNSEYISPTSPTTSDFRRMTTNNWDVNAHEGSQLSYGEVNGVSVNGREDELSSNILERTESKLGEAIPTHSTELVRPLLPIKVNSDSQTKQQESGRDDPPGPRYESYGSSFGNMGPLPPQVLITPPRSARLTSSVGDDAATITQDDLRRVCSGASRILKWLTF